jgi:membrane-associated phospholipid phosphatase
MHHLQSSDLQGLFIAEPIQRILNDLEGIKRDAFPSGHTGVALVVSALAWRFHRGFFFITLPAIVMLIVATVYCRYHYVVDVIGGVVLAVLTLVLGERYYGYWEIRNTLNR